MFIVFLTFALLASGITVNKIILASLSPAFFVATRMLLAGIIILIYCKFNRSEKIKWVYIKQDFLTIRFKGLDYLKLPTIIIVSLFTTFIPSVLKSYALKNMLSSKVTLLGSIDPFITAVYAYFLLNEKLTLNKLLGMIVAIIGISILVISTSNTEIGMQAWGVLSYPEIATLLSVSISRYGWMIVQKLLKQNRYSPLELNGLTMTISGFVALIFSLNQETLPSLSVFNLKLILQIIYTVFIGNILAYWLYAKILKDHSSTLIALAGFSVPLFVYAYALTFLNESWSNIFVISAGITLLGMIIFYREDLKTKKLY